MAPDNDPPNAAAISTEPSEQQATALTDQNESHAATPGDAAPADEPPAVALAANMQDSPMATADFEGPQRRTAFYRLDANAPAAIPGVVLSKGHEALCHVKVGDTMPAVELPELGGGPRELADLLGERATVVVFWKSDRYMARQQLADMGPDVIDLFGDSGVAVVGIAVNEPPAQSQRMLAQVAARFPNLLDTGGDVFAKVGSEKLPRTYLLDPQGRILWFDIEYSLATRRELHQALRFVTGEPASGEPASAGGNEPAPQ